MTYLPSFSSQLLMLSDLFRSSLDCSFSLEDAFEDALDDAMCACTTPPPMLLDHDNVSILGWGEVQHARCSFFSEFRAHKLTYCFDRVVRP